MLVEFRTIAIKIVPLEIEQNDEEQYKYYQRKPLIQKICESLRHDFFSRMIESL
jgi:hypothetical protein